MTYHRILIIFYKIKNKKIDFRSIFDQKAISHLDNIIDNERDLMQIN